MSIWQDWKFWAFVVTIGSQAGVACLIWWVQSKIRFNDLAHLETYVKENKAVLDKIAVKVIGNSERISKIEGQIS